MKCCLWKNGDRPIIISLTLLHRTKQHPDSWPINRNATCPAWLTNTVFSFLALSHCRLIWRGYKQPLDESDLLDLNEEDKAEYWVSAFEKKWRGASNAAGYATTLTSTYGMSNNKWLSRSKQTNNVCSWAVVPRVSLQRFRLINLIVIYPTKPDLYLLLFYQLRPYYTACQ